MDACDDGLSRNCVQGRRFTVDLRDLDSAFSKERILNEVVVLINTFNNGKSLDQGVVAAPRRGSVSGFAGNGNTDQGASFMTAHKAVCAGLRHKDKVRFDVKIFLGHA